MVEEAIAILQQAGFDLTAREIAEIFWLAVHLDESIQESEPSTLSQDQSQKAPNKNSDIQADTHKSSPEKKRGADLYQPSSQPKKIKESGEAIPIKVPAALALRNSLALGRAFRPLMGKVPSATETILDVEATVYQIAESNIWLPVLKPASDRWLELALVVEKTSSTAVWKQTITELQHLVKHHGAFRDVRTWELTITDTKVNLFSQTSTGRYDSTPYPPQVLIDPKKQRLILLVSDCISVAWRRQFIHPVLKLWGRNGLLTILQLLPERLWERTALASEIPVQLHSLSPGVVNSEFIVKAWDEEDIDHKSSSVNVPVVTLEPYPLLAWSQVIAGQGNVTTVGFKFDVSQDPHAQGRGVDAKPSQAQPEASALVSRFLATASVMARRLAGLMAAAPVSLPVVQLIQENLLPKSAQIHVAEVFMSGLLQSITPVDQDSNPDYIEYDFKPGVRELLVDSVPISKTVSVIDKVSEFVANQLGLSVQDFEARLVIPATASNDLLEEKIRPFAQLKAQVLQRLGGEYARLAEQIIISEISIPANPPGYLLKKINEALRSAFPSQIKLAMMLQHQFNINLEEVAPGEYLTEIVYKLVQYFNTSNRLARLIDKALKENPDNHELKAIKENFKITTSLINILLPLEKHFIKQMQQAYRASCPEELLDDWWEYELPDTLFEILANLDDIPQPNDEKNIIKFVVSLLQTGDIPKSEAEQLKQWIKENVNNPNDLSTNEDFTEEVNSNPQHNSPKNANVLQELRYANLVRPPLALNNFSSANPSELKQFSFKVVTVNRTGDIIKKENKQANYFTQDLGNGVDLEMVYIPAGSFLMGSPKSERDSDDSERPQHQVNIQPFFLGKYQVTQAQWQAVAKLPKVKRDLDLDPSRFKGKNRPVEQVSWFDAVEFCDRLSEYTGTEYRLPSEGEWEYACRAGTTTPFHYGETITSKLANYDASYIYAEEAKGKYRGETTPVGRFPPNGFGLYDMHGNVYEWCGDPYHDNYFGAPTDGTVWTLNYHSNDYYLIRGGSWGSDPRNFRSASRNFYIARDLFNFDLGFRVARGVGRI